MSISPANAAPETPAGVYRVESYASDGHLPDPAGAVGLLGDFVSHSIDKYGDRLRDAGYDIANPGADFRITDIGTWDGESYDGQHSPRLDIERITKSDGTPLLVFTRRHGQDMSIVSIDDFRGGHSWDGYTVFSRVAGHDFTYTSEQAQHDLRSLRAPYPDDPGDGRRLGHALAITEDVARSFNNSALDRAMDDAPRFDVPPTELERVVGSKVYEASTHKDMSRGRQYAERVRTVSRRAAATVLHASQQAFGLKPKTKHAKAQGRVRVTP